MTRTYTAADFANARFAEHPDGGIAMRSEPGYFDQWDTNVEGWHSDDSMAHYGWVPVPSKPTITESQFAELSEDLKNRTTILACALERVGIKIIPDPEPTNTDKLTRLINSAQLTGMDARNIAEYLNGYGIRVKGN